MGGTVVTEKWCEGPDPHVTPFPCIRACVLRWTSSVRCRACRTMKCLTGKMTVCVCKYITTVFVYFSLSVRKKLTSGTGSWLTTTVKDTAISWPSATMAEEEPARKKTKRKWWKPKNNSTKSNESSTSSTRSCTMSCPPCTILGCCFWSPICNRISPPNNCFIANRQRYVNVVYLSWTAALELHLNDNLYNSAARFSEVFILYYFFKTKLT